MSLQHAQCMLLQCTFSTGGKFKFYMYMYVVTRSYSNHPFLCNTFKRTREWRYVHLVHVHVHSQGADVGGEGWLGCEPVEGVVVLEER